MDHATRHRAIVKKLDAIGFPQSRICICFDWKRDRGYAYRVLVRPTQALQLILVANGIENEILDRLDAWIAQFAEKRPKVEQLSLF
jgi:hypothetical protein